MGGVTYWAGLPVWGPTLSGPTPWGPTVHPPLRHPCPLPPALLAPPCSSRARVGASLAALPEALDPARGAAYGGSHGGFLTAWLLGCEDRALFGKGGVLWNPVVDLPAMLGTTDIPEWVNAEALSGDSATAAATWPLTPETLLELHSRSPMSVVDKVEAPALMLLGAADQRVPHKQGRSWVSAIQQIHQRTGGGGKKLDLTALEFPGEGHAIASVEGNAHAQQSAVAWLVERLKKTDASGAEGQAA